MKKFATHMGRKVRIADNFARPEIKGVWKTPKPVSVDAMTRAVVRKFPVVTRAADHMRNGIAVDSKFFDQHVNVREVVLFVRKLCRK